MRHKYRSYDAALGVVKRDEIIRVLMKKLDDTAVEGANMCAAQRLEEQRLDRWCNSLPDHVTGHDAFDSAYKYKRLRGVPLYKKRRHHHVAWPV